MIFHAFHAIQAIPRPLRVPIVLPFHMILHAIPCHSKPFPDPCGYHSCCFLYMIFPAFHAIPSHSQTLEGTNRFAFLYDIPRHSMLFQAIPRPLWLPIMSPFHMMLHAIPCYSEPFLDPCGYQSCCLLCDIPAIPCNSKPFPDPCDRDARAPGHSTRVHWEESVAAVARHCLPVATRL